MKEISYLVAPFIAWFLAGTLKFIINSIKTKSFAFGLIGYGGMPSTHSAIVSSMTALVALRDGINTPAFGVAITLMFIVLLDASSLRKQVGKHAEALNKLNVGKNTGVAILRERMGHTRLEIFAGVLVGCTSGLIVNYL